MGGGDWANRKELTNYMKLLWKFVDDTSGKITNVIYGSRSAEISFITVTAQIFSDFVIAQKL